VYQETWQLAEYLSQVSRLTLAWGGFWILLAASPALILAAGPYRWEAATLLGVALLLWSLKHGEMFIRLSGSSPLARPDLHLRFQGVMEKANVPRPRLLRFGSPRGRLANALALPETRLSAVLFGETLLEALEPDEITAIFAHEVAHLEYYNGPRLWRLGCITWIGIAVTVLAAPILHLALPGHAASAVWAGPAVTVAVLLTLQRGQRAREAASDRRAVALCGDAEALVRGLTKLYALARLPRRWPHDHDKLGTHPSLVRRIQAIRASGGSVVGGLSAPVVAASPTAGAFVVLEADRAAWLDGVPIGTPREPDPLQRAAHRARVLRYSELLELWVKVQAHGARLVATDLQGTRWEVDLLPGDVAAVQSALDSVDVRLASPSRRPRTAWLRGLAANLAAGVRVALLCPGGRLAWQVSADHVIALAGINLGLLVLGAMVSAGDWDVPWLHWVLFQVTGAAAWVALLLLWGHVIARLEHDRVPSLAFPVTALAAYACFLALALLVAGLGLLEPESRSRAIVWLVCLTWFALASVSAMRATLGRWSIRVMAYASVTFMAAMIVAGYLPSPFWPPAVPEAAEAEERQEPTASPAAEDTLYRQPQLLEAALRSLTAGRPGMADLYFVGFGADAGQDVFMKEVETVRRLFDERFDTRGRSVALVNNAETLDRLPLATTWNLAAALRRIGQLMNPEEDVLFLYLTSHGSGSEGLSVQFWPLELHQLDAPRLRALLDDAGIKWRVIVVSACYSGSLIPALQGDATLIATAADADRMSFGCGRTDDFTYFGQAYFDEALRETRSFLRAFDLARAAVLRREEAEQRTPSRPQLSVGAAIRTKLEQLERQLSARAAS
jgi:Zn-dependent protease with chaperone function